MNTSQSNPLLAIADCAQYVSDPARAEGIAEVLAFLRDDSNDYDAEYVLLRAADAIAREFGGRDE